MTLSKVVGGSAHNSPAIMPSTNDIRPTSAPPDLELSSKNVFAFSPTQADYSRIFSLWGESSMLPTSLQTTHALSASNVPTEVACMRHPYSSGGAAASCIGSGGGGPVPCSANEFQVSEGWCEANRHHTHSMENSSSVNTPSNSATIFNSALGGGSYTTKMSSPFISIIPVSPPPSLSLSRSATTSDTPSAYELMYECKQPKAKTAIITPMMAAMEEDAISHLFETQTQIQEPCTNTSSSVPSTSSHCFFDTDTQYTSPYDCYLKIPPMQAMSTYETPWTPPSSLSNTLPAPLQDTSHHSIPICKFFAHGNCKRGRHCHFAHMMTTVSSSSLSSSLSSSSLSSSSLSSSSLSSSSSSLLSSSLSSSSSFSSPPLSPFKDKKDVEADRTKKNYHAYKMHTSSIMKAHERHITLTACNSMNKIRYSNFAHIEDVRHRVCSLAMDQHGCRLLQRALDEYDPALFEVIYHEVCARLNVLVTDLFGNYLCQRLLHFCSDEQRVTFLMKISPDLVAISLNLHGTRVVQKMVEMVRTPLEMELMRRALFCSIVTLAKDMNGNHVIQRCLVHMPSSDKQFIYDAISSHCLNVATHKHGCCVMQRCIDYATIRQRAQIVSVVAENALDLVQDAYGNYVVQYVLDLESPIVCRAVMIKCMDAVAQLAVQKFSSNVVEKMLAMAPRDVRDSFIEKLCTNERLPRLLQDPYANYVIQKALSVCDVDQFNPLIIRLRPHVAALAATMLGKRIQSKMIKRFPTLASTQQTLQIRASSRSLSCTTHAL